MAPSASSTDAFSPVPPMSTANVNGCLGSVVGDAVAVELEVSPWSVMPTRYADLPVVAMEDSLEGQPAPPSVAFEPGYLLTMADRPHGHSGRRPPARGVSQ